MKHIVFCTPGFAPHIGGVEKHVTAVATQLGRLGYRVSVVTPKESQGENILQHLTNVSVITLEGDAHSKRDVWLWVLRQWRLFVLADVVHVHDVAWWILPVLPLIFMKFFITFHGWEGEYPIPLLHKLQRRFFSVCARATIHIGAYIQEFYGDKPTCIMYGGVAAENIMFAHKSNKQSIVFVGRLAADTDVPLYIKYFKKLKAQLPAITITWVGDGPLHNLCARYGQVTGFVEHPEKYTQRARLVCAASYLSCLEAIAVGKKVLAVHSHFLKERYLKVFPFADRCIIDSASFSTMCDVMTLLKQEEYITQDTQKQLQRRLLDFTWGAVTKQYVHLWETQPPF